MTLRWHNEGQNDIKWTILGTLRMSSNFMQIEIQFVIFDCVLISREIILGPNMNNYMIIYQDTAKSEILNRSK